MSMSYEEFFSYHLDCDKGIAPACVALGKIYHLRGDIQKGRRYLIEGCNYGDYAGCTSLGIIYYKEENMPKARPYLKRACRGGYKRACRILKRLLENKVDAIRLYRIACADGDSRGCVEDALFEFKEASKRRAAYLFKYSCNNKKKRDWEACANLGVLHLEYGDVDTGVILLIDSCNKGVLTACVEYGIWDYKNKDKKRALETLQKACNKQEMSGCVVLGELAEKRGELIKAKEYYNQACKRKSITGCKYYLGLY